MRSAPVRLGSTNQVTRLVVLQCGAKVDVGLTRHVDEVRLHPPPGLTRTLPFRGARPPPVFSSSPSCTCTLARHSHSQSRCVHTHGESFALPSTLPSRFVRPPAVFSSSFSRTCTLARHSQSTHRPSSRSRSACTSARPPKWPCASG